MLFQPIVQSYSHPESMAMAKKKHRCIEQQNKIERQERNPCIHGHLISEKGGTNI